MKTDYAKIKSFMAKHATRMTEDELKKEADALFEKKNIEEDKLVEAYKAKKIKSKSAMRKARAVMAAREAKAKAKKKEENNK